MVTNADGRQHVLQRAVLFAASPAIHALYAMPAQVPPNPFYAWTIP